MLILTISSEKEWVALQYRIYYSVYVYQFIMCTHSGHGHVIHGHSTLVSVGADHLGTGPIRNCMGHLSRPTICTSTILLSVLAGWKPIRYTLFISGLNLLSIL